MIKEVLVVFKTHLDIGFTDYSKNVVDKYLNNFIPSAIETGYKLKDTDTPFVWTVGSWLVNEGLKRDKDGMLEKAIKDGIISWHGLPFTSHTELMNTKLFEYGLSISKKLDERFGTHTIGS
ncbi:MAG: glycoside hydrolase, partial [Firmicutes bacterium]|nr:glycoside hydrolase [Bacillota bacterium]